MDLRLLSLIMIALLIGWVFGRWVRLGKYPGKVEYQNRVRYSESYAKGLNYLLTDQSDKAIQTFTELSEMGPDSIEIHLTVGKLYRSKGEVERAIKVHQNLLARPNLTRSQRNVALAELASDYLKAGLHDRAEKLYRELIQLDMNDLMAYRQLLELYIAEKSWAEALQCAQVLYGRGEPNAAVVLSHCYCEIADLALQNGNKKLAESNLLKAQNVDSNCVRAGLLLIKLQLDVKEHIAAGKSLRWLMKHNPKYMPLYIEPAQSIYKNSTEDDAYEHFLQQEYAARSSNCLAIALLEHYLDSHQIVAARQFLEKILRQAPSLDAFEFAFRFLKSQPDQVLDTSSILADFLKNMRDKKVEYICAQCGYGSHSIQWHCPSCSSWSTMEAI